MRAAASETAHACRRAGAAPATTRIAPQPLGACACAMGSSPQDRGADGLAAAIPAPRPLARWTWTATRSRRRCATCSRARRGCPPRGPRRHPKRVAKAMAFAVRGYGMSATHHVESALFHEPGLKSDEEALAEALADDEPPALCAPIPADPSALARPSTVLIRDVPFFSTNEDNLSRSTEDATSDTCLATASSSASAKSRASPRCSRDARRPRTDSPPTSPTRRRGAAPRGVRRTPRGGADGTPRTSARPRRSGRRVFQSTHPEGAQYRAEFAAMLAEEVGAGIGPGWASAGGGSAVPEHRRARGVSRPSPEGRHPRRTSWTTWRWVR